MIDISKYDKADVLAVLYNNSRQQGMGFLDVSGTQRMTSIEAAQLLEGSGPHYFDYLRGRVMKVQIDDSGQLDPRLYDRDNGPGAAERAISTLYQANAA